MAQSTALQPRYPIVTITVLLRQSDGINLQTAWNNHSNSNDTQKMRQQALSEYDNKILQKVFMS